MADRDMSFEALALACGVDWTKLNAQSRGPMNAALKAIRESEPRLEDDELALMIDFKAKAYRTVYAGLPITPTALAKHWASLDAQKAEMEKPIAYNLPGPPSECPTCGGDKLVVYSTRPAENPVEGHVSVYEEFAPCPDCNSGASVGFWRGDGSRFNAPDSGLVRRRIGA